MSPQRAPLRVSLVATPDTQVAPLSGLYEALNAFELLANFEPGLPRQPFQAEIVAPSRTPILSASGLPLGIHRACDEVERSDIVIVPLMMATGGEWVPGRYPGLVDWLIDMHGQGAMLCSSCTGVLLLAESGLLDGREATLHWAFAPTFRRNFPAVRLRTEEALVVCGDRHEFVMSGGVTSWHDLVLHLIALHVGPSAARAMGRLLMLEWHGDGQAPYMTFSPPSDHGDAVIADLQHWLHAHYRNATAVDEMLCLSGLSRRTFERRFAKATGSTPIGYVQSLRVEQAKRLLERGDTAIDEISHDVGYENTAFFRRLFKRGTRLTPGQYRRRFQPPGQHRS